MKIKAVLTVLIFFISFVLLSQEGIKNESSDSSSPAHSLGFHLGSTTGMGLSYRFLPKKLGIQATFLPVFNGNGGMFLSSGLSILYKLKSSRRVDLFGYLGNHLTYRESAPGFYGEQNVNRNYHVGLGAGINLHAWIDVLDISFQMGYGVYSVNENPRSLPAAEIGFYYKF
ncbi:MAG: hypothetical protein WED10_01100 [Brumimicrobium sp.]